MREISEFLHIEYNDKLCIPTENLKPGVANSMYINSRVKGVVKNQSENYR